MTIHKSQGGTFSEIVYEYTNKQSRNLVYVALSRVSNINGLYITTPNNQPFDFSHGTAFDSSSDSVRNLKEEFLRLNNHKLTTITSKALKFAESSCDILVINLNVQSLNAHSYDISGDSVLPLADYFALTETWMRQPNTTPISGFECVVSCNKSSESNKSVGGSAIYRRAQSLSTFSPIDLAQEDNNTQDMCMGLVKINKDNRSVDIVIGSVYIHPNTTMSDIYYIIKKFVDNSATYPSIYVEILILMCLNVQIS